ncbi:2-C-methyl-D-erythritol 4-phosphate cytidylyltransferase [Immundisolibacter sp.]|uniref:2-C-methyl-D-erythritol 4-phosphate cytidylyltransferase n=1 Tax=Immundisolibacter sp. TaxID=1934948 RepID=UPI00261D94F8|nr:2-C-methyl-D-erythritol 4-phosphate cytidylyltransferase [Immundisolibacter sp.]MDD3650674.1 2-C-methyl-D-erythritol 4-phosphate cytidylyltransferase [Immundisolibacter sp.]
MPTSAADHWAIVPAAGIGARMGAERPKQYLPLAGRPLLLHTLDRLLAAPRVAGLVLTLRADDPHWPALGFRADKPLHVVSGGACRAASVLAALDELARQLAADTPLLVHDAVRPLLHASDIERLCGQPLDAHGCLLAMPLTDTIKRADAGGRSEATVPRDGLWAAQTPQRFQLGVLRTALRDALAAGSEPTDEAQAMERAGWRPRLVPGRRDNLKITVPQDLPLAECLLAAQQCEDG